MTEIRLKQKVSAAVKGAGAGRRIHLVDGAIEADDRRDQLPTDGTAPPADDTSGRTRPGGMGAKGDKG